MLFLSKNKEMKGGKVLKNHKYFLRQINSR